MLFFFFFVQLLVVEASNPSVIQVREMHVWTSRVGESLIFDGSHWWSRFVGAWGFSSSLCSLLLYSLPSFSSPTGSNISLKSVCYIVILTHTYNNRHTHYIQIHEFLYVSMDVYVCMYVIDWLYICDFYFIFLNFCLQDGKNLFRTYQILYVYGFS